MKAKNNSIRSAKDLEDHITVLKAYIGNEESKVMGKLPALDNPFVLKLAGIAGAFLLKSLLKRIRK
jgi:hypothetical protein